MTETRPALAALHSWREQSFVFLLRSGAAIAWLVSSAVIASDVAGTLRWSQTLWLGAYPAIDAAATLVERGAPSPTPRLLRGLRVSVDLATAAALLLTHGASLSTTMAVIGGWAIGTGLLMIGQAALQLRAFRSQWLIIFSGVGSTVAGLGYVHWQGSGNAAFGSLVQYAIGGTIWYLIVGLALAVGRAKRLELR